MKEVTLYTNGDSQNLSTWSNVPYMFAQALERRGIIVNRVNIEANKTLNRLYNSIFFKLFKVIFKRDASPIFYRSPFHRWIINRRLKKVAEQYRNSDLNLFLSYLFINKYSDKPNVLWCDWTDRISIERMGREPKWYEKWSLRQEDKTVKSADVRYTMFPVCKRHQEELYNVEFRYLDRNVVNTVFDGYFELEKAIVKRFNSEKLLFIGNHRYKGAALELINVFRQLKIDYPSLSLDIVGMTSAELGLFENECDITCHGYLQKDIEIECSKYYDLLLSAKIFVNPASQWGGYSSTIEAMYYGCPIIVSPYDDFVENFGEQINFGLYHYPNQLFCEIDSLLQFDFEKYKYMAENSASCVGDYTWDRYIECFIEDVEQQLVSKDE